MTPRKTVNHDATTQGQAAEILGIPVGSIKRLIREGRLHRVPKQFPSMSREEALAFQNAPVEQYWVTGSEAARLMGISTTRIGQLADTARLPFVIGETGRRRFRRSQVLVIRNARAARWHGEPINVN